MESLTTKSVIDERIVEAENAKPTDELGIVGLLQFRGIVEEAYLAELRWPTAYAKLNEMRRRDPTIAALLNAINLLARTASWSVEAASTSDADQQAADFLEECLADMSLTAEDAVEDLLTAIPFGWAWNEIVYKRRSGNKTQTFIAAEGSTQETAESKYDDGKIGWRKWAPRRQSSLYRWEMDANGGVKGLWQSVQTDMKNRFIPIDRSIHFTAQRDMGNPEGLSILEPIYEAWHYVKNLQIINGIGFERSFVGLPTFQYAEGYTPTADDKKLVEKTGKGLRVGEKAYVAMPANITFKLETTSNTNAESLLKTVEQYRVLMLQVVLADFISLGTMSRSGSFALGQDKSLLFLMGVDGWLDKIAHVDKLGVLNRYAVPRLFSYNSFPGISDYPKIKHSPVQKPDLGAVATYLNNLATFIHPTPELEEELLRIANLPTTNVPTDQVIEDTQTTDPSNNNGIGGGEPSTGGPGTGDQAGNAMDGGGSASMSAEIVPSTARLRRSAQDAEPHPTAREQKYYFLAEWNRLKAKFEAAMNQHG